MQERNPPEIVAALINIVGFLGVAALGGLFVLAVMAHSVEAMRGCVLIAATAYLSQVCTAAAEFFPIGSARRNQLSWVALFLWAAVIVAFLVALVLI